MEHVYNVGDQIVLTMDIGNLGPREGTVGVITACGIDYDAGERYYSAKMDGWDHPMSLFSDEMLPYAAPAKKARRATKERFRAATVTPQAKTILKHLEKRGSISPMEALVSYQVFRLAARVLELREAGHPIVTTIRRDEAGKHYARYLLAA